MSDRNGSNPRLDRIERMIEGLSKSHAESDAQQARRWAESEAQHERWKAASDAQHERWKAEMAESEAQQKRRWAESDARFERSQTRIDKNHAKIQSDLKRWAALGVKEARNQRKRYQKIDEYITRLSAAQLVTEEKLKNLLSSRGNGQHGGGRKSA